MGGDQEHGPGPGGHWAPAPTGGREVSVARKPSDHRDLILTASSQYRASSSLLTNEIGTKTHCFASIVITAEKNHHW